MTAKGDPYRYSHRNCYWSPKLPPIGCCAIYANRDDWWAPVLFTVYSGPVTTLFLHFERHQQRAAVTGSGDRGRLVRACSQLNSLSAHSQLCSLSAQLTLSSVHSQLGSLSAQRWVSAANSNTFLAVIARLFCRWLVTNTTLRDWVAVGSRLAHVSSHRRDASLSSVRVERWRLACHRQPGPAAYDGTTRASLRWWPATARYARQRDFADADWSAARGREIWLVAPASVASEAESFPVWKPNWCS